MIKLTHEILHDKIRAHETLSLTDETYYEFIRSSEKEFEMEPRDLTKLTDEELHEYLLFLDDLWLK